MFILKIFQWYANAQILGISLWIIPLVILITPIVAWEVIKRQKPKRRGKKNARKSKLRRSN